MKDATGALEKPHDARPEARRATRAGLNRSVDLHIDELRLDGFRAGDKYLIGEALQSELARLLGDRGTPESFGQSISVDMLNAGDIRVEAESRPGAMGREIARNIHRSLTVRPNR